MPLTKDQIETMIKAALPDADVTVTPLANDGDHFKARVHSLAFRRLSRLAQHQLVYASLEGRMGTELHALQLETSVVPRCPA